MKETELLEMISILNETIHEDGTPLLKGRKQAEGGESIVVLDEDVTEEVIEKFIDAIEWIDDNKESNLIPEEVVKFYESAPWKDGIEEEGDEPACECVCSEEGPCEAKTVEPHKYFNLESHEAANIFPMELETIGQLADDIKVNGQQEMIKLFEGKILDGRRRYEACKVGKIEPKSMNVDDMVKDPIAYVVSLNVHRRHLTPSQRSMAASKAKSYYEDSAKERQSAGLKKGKKISDSAVSKKDKGQSRDKAGKAVGVSGKMVDYATKVTKKGEPELIQAVEEGKISVQVAAKVADKPKAEQKKIAADAKKGIKPKVQDPKQQPIDDSKTTEKYVVDTTLYAMNILDKIPKENVYREVGWIMVETWLQEQKEKFPPVIVLKSAPEPEPEKKAKVNKEASKKK